MSFKNSLSAVIVAAVAALYLIALFLSPSASLAGASALKATGEASYYMRGRLTANGERFDAKGLTCAHPTMTFGTRLRVTNLGNGRSVVCRVNDRGPASLTGRIIDVSLGCAVALGMVKAGVARVAVEVVGPAI